MYKLYRATLQEMGKGNLFTRITIYGNLDLHTRMMSIKTSKPCR